MDGVSAWGNTLAAVTRLSVCTVTKKYLMMYWPVPWPYWTHTGPAQKLRVRGHGGDGIGWGGLLPYLHGKDFCTLLQITSYAVLLLFW